MKNEGLELNLSENREGELLMIKENETDNPVLARVKRTFRKK